MMDTKNFKRHEKAVISDLNSVEKFSEFEYGKFIGIIEINKIWLDLNKKQYNKLKGYIDETFTKNFSIFNKRKKFLKERGDK